MSLTPNRFPVPNIRRCFIPDTGYEICESDLKQADARVVAWEANDETLKAIFNDPSADLHDINTMSIYNIPKPADDQDPNWQRKRNAAKAGVHLTNYGGHARTCARALGITVHEAEQFQWRWFDLHPAIPEWHRKIQSDLECNRKVVNAFGYQRIYFSRIEDAFTEALAWIPQSTVALVISKALIKMHTQHSDLLQPLLQVHDSTTTQYEVSMRALALPAIKQCMEVTIPYPDPLIIPADLAVSSVSWGDVKRVR